MESTRVRELAYIVHLLASFSARLELVLRKTETSVFESVGWIFLAQNSVRWLAIVNKFMNLPVYIKVGKCIRYLSDCYQIHYSSLR